MGLAAVGDVVDDQRDLISVVVCTTGRRRTLWKLLESLRAIDDPAFEVLVVENSRAPTLPAQTLCELGVRHLVETQIGLDAARNRGAREAAGSIVAYVDDDCEVQPGWLGGLRRGFADVEVSLVTGRVLPGSLEMTSQWLFQQWCSWDRGVVPLRFPSAEDPPMWFPVATHHLGTGCNMAFRRADLLAAGGFDEGLDMGSLIGGGGDLDAFARLLDAGHIAHYEPTALVRHTHRATMHDLRWQVWGYGLAQGALLAKWFVTRDGLRREVLGFWLHRLRLKVHQMRFKGSAPVPRRIIVFELAGILVGPLAYVPSRLLAWSRRLRR